VSSPSRRRLTPDARREQLLDTAVQLAAGRGLASVSVAEIAEAAGVSEGLLYHYFPTKDALLAAALRRAADALIATVDAAAGGAPMDALGAGLGAYLDHVQADPTGWRAVLQARTGVLAEIGASVEEHSRRLTLTALGVDSPSAALEVALDGWAALERAACLTWLEHPEIERSAMEDLLESSFFATLTAAARHDPQTRRVLEGLGAVSD
jgi:AcrR family transcriptional regulator